MLSLPNELLLGLAERAGTCGLLSLARTCKDFAWLSALAPARPTGRRPEPWPLAAIGDGDEWRQLGEHLCRRQFGLTAAGPSYSADAVWWASQPHPTAAKLHSVPDNFRGDKFLVYGAPPGAPLSRYVTDCAWVSAKQLARPPVPADRWRVFFFDSYFADVTEKTATFHSLDGAYLRAYKGKYRRTPHGEDPMLALDGRLFASDGPGRFVALSPLDSKLLAPFPRQNNSDHAAFLFPTARRVVLITKHGKAAVYDRGTLELDFTADLAEVHGCAISVENVLARNGDVQITFNERLDVKAKNKGVKASMLAKGQVLYWRVG